MSCLRLDARLVAAVVLVAAAALINGATPRADATRAKDVYGHVSHLGWVVRDADATAAAWQRLGVHQVSPARVEELPVSFRGQPMTVRVRKIVAQLGTLAVQWIQPLGESGAYADFLRAHGEGVQHVAFSVPTSARFDEELASFGAQDVGVVQQGTWQGRAGTGRFAYLDTARQGGGMTMELEFNPDAAPVGASAAPGNDDPFNKVTQFAFVVKDVHAVGAYWERLGFTPLKVEPNVSLDRVLRGAPGRFEMLLGWGRGGDVPFEWIQSTVGPNVYEEQLAAHGEGFHHLGLDVADMDAAVARLKERGLSVTMSGGWNVNGYEGRFAYLDADAHGGVTIELLWNKPRPGR